MQKKMLLLLKHVELLLQCVPGPVPRLLWFLTRVVLDVIVVAAGEASSDLIGVPHLRQEAPLRAARDGAHGPEARVNDPDGVLFVKPQGAHGN